MKKPGPPPPPPIRPPDPPDWAASDPKIAQLYAQARELHDAGRFQEALRVYEQLASINPSDGRVSLLIGNLYWWGTGTAPDHVQGERWLERAARSGEHRAYLSLAAICASQGLPDSERAWLEEAAAKGYAPALYYLGSAWEFGRWGRIDRARAVEQYERAAAKGYRHAAMRLGVSLMRGERGLLRMPLGMLRYAASFVQMVVLLYRDPSDERVMW
jgi:TPR repeat protein